MQTSRRGVANIIGAAVFIVTASRNALAKSFHAGVELGTWIEVITCPVLGFVDASALSEIETVERAAVAVFAVGRTDPRAAERDLYDRGLSRIGLEAKARGERRIDFGRKSDGEFEMAICGNAGRGWPRPEA